MNQQESKTLREMQAAGFTDLDQYNHQPRIFAMTTAPEKRGKTRFTCTLPGPIAVISADTGTKPIMDKVAKKEFGRKVLIYDMVAAKHMSGSAGADEWQKILGVFSMIVAAPPSVVRSLVVDTGTHLWDLCRLATLGKLTQVKAHHYGVANHAFESAIMALYSRKDLNVIFTHKAGKKYVDDKWDGRSLEPKGYSGMGFLVDLVLTHYIRTETDRTITYGVRIDETREEMSTLKGLELESNVNRSDECGGPIDESNVQTLGTVIYGPESAKVWE